MLPPTVTESGSSQSPQESRAPAGWYPDPQGSGNLFYWDGSQWTGDVSGAESSTRPTGGRSSTARRLLIGGGVALAISPLLPWVNVILLGNLNLFQLLEAAGGSNGVAWAAVLLGGGAAFVAWRERSVTTVRTTGLLVGLLSGLLALYALADLRHDIRDVQGLAAVGIGPYLAIAGCVAMVVGAVMTKSQDRQPSR